MLNLLNIHTSNIKIRLPSKEHIYTTTTAATPNNAPRPITPVSKARAAPPLEMDEGGFVGVPDTEVAPGKATEVVLGFGAAEAFSGLRTLSLC